MNKSKTKVAENLAKPILNYANKVNLYPYALWCSALASLRIIWAAFSAIAIVGLFVLPLVMVGIMRIHHPQTSHSSHAQLRRPLPLDYPREPSDTSPLDGICWSRCCPPHAPSLRRFLCAFLESARQAHTCPQGLRLKYEAARRVAVLQQPPDGHDLSPGSWG